MSHCDSVTVLRDLTLTAFTEIGKTEICYGKIRVIWSNNNKNNKIRDFTIWFTV